MSFVWLWLAVGCVPKKDFLALESDLASTRATMQAELAARDETIAGLRGDVAALEAERERLTAELAEKERMLGEVRETNASILNDKGRLAGEIAQMKAALADLQERKALADARVREFRDLLDRFKALIDAGTLKVKIKDGRMIVELATDVLFASGSATLSDDGKKALAEVAQILATLPGREFQIEGHTDNDPIATAQFPNNWALASQRALNVVSHLLANGMNAQRVSGASFGEHRPVAPNDSKENKALNRRIEIVVVPDLSQLPGFDELQAISNP